MVLLGEKINRGRSSVVAVGGFHARIREHPRQHPPAGKLGQSLGGILVGGARVVERVDLVAGQEAEPGDVADDGDVARCEGHARGSRRTHGGDYRGGGHALRICVVVHGRHRSSADGASVAPRPTWFCRVVPLSSLLPL